MKLQAKASDNAYDLEKKNKLSIGNFLANSVNGYPEAIRLFDYQFALECSVGTEWLPVVTRIDSRLSQRIATETEKL